MSGSWTVRRTTDYLTVGGLYRVYYALDDEGKRISPTKSAYVLVTDDYSTCDVSDLSVFSESGRKLNA